ncbi:hypothetical protein EMIHUDRAFT_252037 [Emiliania huxleyi CCMP1516]|uniref:Uncharacterized protein n=2 Tax=Emiliania huxleyi TaxID=2903 RepID=A0A0D3KP98_EMIH1|nr:hypothetical protein EMIHUDRAFT_252037 [Emiliania huxleyi CCMP1516]EOD37583.1 hypothetical protein EMIHUDRAFT_252037 [Emiliania huxleyi CCMP1516]|eukprot:XP_005790012.1 hypothetical protein EMIHUDRAFT_252037 [Emiliania huxleyi CCMP1516]
MGCGSSTFEEGQTPKCGIALLDEAAVTSGGIASKLSEVNSAFEVRAVLKALRAYVKAAVSNFAESGMSNPLAEIVGAFTANVSFMNGACPIVIDFGKLEIAGIANAVMQELKDAETAVASALEGLAKVIGDIEKLVNTCQKYLDNPEAALSEAMTGNICNAMTVGKRICGAIKELKPRLNAVKTHGEALCGEVTDVITISETKAASADKAAEANPDAATLVALLYPLYKDPNRPPPKYLQIGEHGAAGTVLESNAAPDAAPDDVKEAQ